MNDDHLRTHFEFTHQDGSSKYVATVEAILAGEVIDEFVMFMRGCGYADVSIYTHLFEIAEEYFEIEKKRKQMKEDPLIGLD